LAKGDTWQSERRPRRDLRTGVDYWQLTDHRCHSHHLCFTNQGWYADGRRLLIASDRDNCVNLFGLDLETGELRQLTESEEQPPDPGPRLQGASKNPRREEVYYWWGADLIALDLEDLSERLIWRITGRFVPGITSATADGEFVCCVLVEDLGDRLHIDLEHGIVGFQEVWAAHPLCRILRIPVGGGDAEVLLEERRWLGHANASPTHPELVTFCHEGPWNLVDHRIWGFDLRTRESWPIGPREPGRRVGHEHWLEDGEHIGYHGTHPLSGSFVGSVRYDGSDRLESSFAERTTHVHSNDWSEIVGDGTPADPRLLLWRQRDGVFDGPRTILTHRGSFHTAQLQVAPRFSPDGGRIVFTSDDTGYGNVYLVETPAFDGLAAD
jgi:oligogalacturonide lyase